VHQPNEISRSLTVVRHLKLANRSNARGTRAHAFSGIA
jgi:hypothetical protein